ncbi:MAG: FHA domain-containing protein [Elusimicrobia bacterium]|nr:FHA domain-containing protein [Elusimicrobiota bacterium]
MPKLLLKFNAAVLKEITLTQPIITVGRKADNDIVIDHPAVSGHHCKIYKQGDAYWVEDLDSTNGTFHNDKKMIRAGLHNNDTIGIVKHILLYIEDDATTPAPSAASSSTAASSNLAQASEQIAQQASATVTRLKAQQQKIALLTVVEGVIDKTEYELAANSSYIGKSKDVQIPIKGLFAPDVAAMIARRPEGYFLIALKPGSAKLNGQAVQERAPLNDADLIEVGGTTFRFGFKG